VYWATTRFSACGGISVTASHSPIDFNGLKFVKSGSEALDPDTEFVKLKEIAQNQEFRVAKNRGYLKNINSAARKEYVKKVLNFIDVSIIKSMKIVINSGNGAAGPCFDAIAKELGKNVQGLNFERIYHEPDPTFPNGVPNPLLVENHAETANKICNAGADFGVAFDGDFDRCFFFDENGEFISSEYIIGLLASIFLEKRAGASIVHDPRLLWNIKSIITECGGNAVQSKVGHNFFKKTMRDCNAVYGGEVSGHHYFKDFAYCDSGMIPWLLVMEKISQTGRSLSQLIHDRKVKYPSSGEVNFYLANPRSSIAKVVSAYEDVAVESDYSDGISLSFKDWRFNLRSSNTESLVRLNIEAIGKPERINEKLTEISDILNS